MPAQEIAFLKQFAVLWTTTGYNRYGQATVNDTPCQIPVRWTTKRRETLDQQGNEIVLDASAMVDRRILIGSLMWLGKMSDWPDGVLPHQEGLEVMEVKTYDETPNLKGRHATRSVGLMRYKETVPQPNT